MKKITIGITAHVDSGKTTLSEAMLYLTGETRKLGRVDHGNSYLDTDAIERDRGITIFAHQASFNIDDTCITLLDTPGHVDFSAETERTMQVIDYAVLVISGTDGIQSHSATLWKLLRQYNIPVFIFVNKMDLCGADKKKVLSELQKRFSNACIDFSSNEEDITESLAMCCDELAEKYLDGESISDDEISNAIAERRIFPCFFGSALKMDGVEDFIKIIGRYAKESQRYNEFGAKVFKISSDAKGNRLTFLKVCGGSLKLRDELTYTNAKGEKRTEKISTIRFYSGAKYRSAELAEAGDICAVTGLSETFAGQGLGCEKNSSNAVLSAVMTYKLNYPDNVNVNDVLKNMRQLEDEDPQLNVIWNSQNREIHLQLMGTVQLEVLSRIIENRFGYSVSFGNGEVSYKETIKNISEGIGHYEPLRHYAEVHLILEPLERGSGMQFELRCSEDLLDRNWQRLILTHLEEKVHKGVLTGSPITDIKIIVASGKAHLKHTEGGDFRQATYRAVRYGLRNAESILLEPYYDFELEVPSDCVGRALTDIQRMCGKFNPPEVIGENTVINGTAPVSEMNDYQAELSGYTKGKGRLTLTGSGYDKCHNPNEVIEHFAYDCDSDIENTADSVFCTHGSGYNVNWTEVKRYMHLPSCLNQNFEDEMTEDFTQFKAVANKKTTANDEELMEIFERTYGKINRDPRKAFKKVKGESESYKNVKLPVYVAPDYLLVDGYNIIFAWDELNKIAKESLDAARGQLINMMCNYQGYAKCELILVFDAYKVKGLRRDIEKYCNINIVYTQESETADTYIERLTHELSKKHRVRVATSDGQEQIIILGNGARRVSASEFHQEVKAAEKSIREHINNMKK